MSRTLALLGTVWLLSGCAVVKDFIRETNCGPNATNRAGCRSAVDTAALSEDAALAGAGKINPYSDDLSRAYLD